MEQKHYRNPTPTVDVIIELEDERIVLIERKNPPIGWALPGGFVDEGELVERAAQREAREETELEVELTDLLYVYSSPDRDPRQHTMSTVYVARAQGEPRAADDARAVACFSRHELPEDLCFDHAEILKDYNHFKNTGARPSPASKLAAHPASSTPSTHGK